MKYSKDIYINKHELDEELIQQPQRYLDWALAWVDAADEKERAKANVELVKAKVESRIRKHPDRYDIPEGKATEPAIKAETLKHKKVKRANERYFKALYNERRLSDTKTAFRQRKAMLEKLVDLNMMLRFSEPKLPTSQQESIYQHRRKNITRRLRESITNDNDNDNSK